MYRSTSQQALACLASTNYRETDSGHRGGNATPHTHREKDKSQPTVFTFRDKQWPEGDAMQLPLFGLEGRPAKHRGLVAPATFPHPLPKAHASWPRQTFRQTSWQLWLPFPQVTSLIVYVCFVQVVILVLMTFLCRCNKVMSIGSFEWIMNKSFKLH